MGGRRLSLVGLVLAVLVAACGGAGKGGSQSGAQDRPTPTATTGGAPTWELVWFSDSGAWGVASDWAKRIERIEGVHVEVFDYIGYGGAGSSATDMLQRVTSDEVVRKQLAGAEVIVLYASNYDVPLDYQKACMSMASRTPPRPLTPAVLQRFRDKLTGIYDEVLALRRGRPTILRALDLYAPMVAQWRAAGVYDACTAGWVANTRVNAEVAAAHGVRVASLYQAFNGPRHDRDPVRRGYIGPDGGHTSTRGKAVILRTLDGLGYEPITP